MSESKHTPGPWSYSHLEIQVRALNEQMHICDIRGWGYLTGKSAMALSDSEGENIQRANGSLIAAAPDMLEALSNIENDDGHIPERIWSMIQEVISKATGKDAS